MNTDDLNFAYKVRHALNEKLDELPASTTDRLAQARQLALARKKAHVEVPLAVRMAKTELAPVGGFMSQFNWLGRWSMLVPALALVIGMAGIYQYEQQERIADLAEIDAAVLSDELPLDAYLDHGFNAYLTQSE
jgi:hypothetical protein